jgi:phage baseplate assembly protein W
LAEYSRAFRDINLSFKSHPVTKDILTLTNEEAIKRSVKNIVFTKIGEKFFDQNYGSTINQALFELDTTLNSIGLQSEIESAIINYEPRVENVSVLVTVSGEDHELTATISYDIVGLPLPTITVEFILLPTRV